MKRVVVVAVLLMLAASLPACAAYQVNWVTGFEPPTYHGGPLPGQNGWVQADNPSYTDEVPLQVVAGAGLNGSTGVVVPNGHSAASRDMRNAGICPSRGYAKFWVYDPGYNPAQGLVDARVGIHSSAGSDSISKMATAQIQDASSRDPNYWYAQWSYSVAKMDGMTGIAPSAGFTFTQGLAAPRVYDAWSYVIMTWAFSYANPANPAGAGNGTIKWYINQTSASPNLTLSFDSTTARWGNFHDVAGLYIGTGATTVSNGRPAAYDNIEWHAVPEPSSLLALSGGMIGLLGLIRKRR